MVFDAIEKTGRLQHGLDDQTNGLFIIASGGCHTGGDAPQGKKFVLLNRASQDPFAHGLNQGPHVVVGEFDIF